MVVNEEPIYLYDYTIYFIIRLLQNRTSKKNIPLTIYSLWWNYKKKVFGIKKVVSIMESGSSLKAILVTSPASEAQIPDNIGNKYLIILIFPLKINII